MSCLWKMSEFAVSAVLFLALALSGCTAAQSIKPYVKPIDIRAGKMAILPFNNLTNDSDAVNVIESASHIAFIQYTPMKIANPDEVREALTKLKIVSFPGKQKIKALRQMLGVDYLVVGTINSFIPGDSPVISLGVRVLDTETGDAVWAINLERKGKDAGNLFGAGRVRSVHMLAQMVSEEIARSFSRSIKRGSGKESGISESTISKIATTKPRDRKLNGKSPAPPPDEALLPQETPSVIERKEAAEALPAVYPESAPQVTVPAIAPPPQPVVAREEAAVPPKKNPDAQSSANVEDQAPAIAKAAPLAAEKTAEPAATVKAPAPLGTAGGDQPVMAGNKKEPAVPPSAAPPSAAPPSAAPSSAAPSQTAAPVPVPAASQPPRPEAPREDVPQKQKAPAANEKQAAAAVAKAQPPPAIISVEAAAQLADGHEEPNAKTKVVASPDPSALSTAIAQGVGKPAEPSAIAVVVPTSTVSGEEKPARTAEKMEVAEAAPVASLLPAQSPRPVQPEAAGESAGPLQKPSVVTSRANGEKEAAAGMKGAVQPVEKVAEPAATKVGAPPEAMRHPQQLAEKEVAVPSQTPPVLPSPASRESAPEVRTAEQIAIVKEINVIADGFEIVTDGTVAGYKTFALRKPPRLVIDVVGAKSVMAGKIRLRGFGIKGARIGAYHGKLRIVLDGLREISPYRIEKTERGLKIIMRDSLPGRTKEGRGKGKMDKAAAPLPVKAGTPGMAANQDICPEKPVEGKTAEAASPLELTIHFDVNRSGIASGYYPHAEKIAAFMKDNPDAVLSIDGHADSTGSPWYNLALSQRRAESVRGFLEKNFSVPSSRIAMKGFGCSRPIADNTLPEGREKNRRTIVHVITPDRKTDGYEIAVKR